LKLQIYSIIGQMRYFYVEIWWSIG